MKRISVFLLGLAVVFSLNVMPAFAQAKETGKAAKSEQKESKKADGKKADTKDKKDAKKKKGDKKK